ncbi:MAG: hypothetical protein RR058_06560 [Oscillospiraceae bacterium]
MNFKKQAGSILAISIIAASLSSCGYNPKTVMKIGDIDISGGVYLSQQLNAVDAAFTACGDKAIVGAAIFNTEIAGVPAREWIDAKTLALCERYAMIKQEAARLSIVLLPVDEYYFTSEASSAWSPSASRLNANGIGYETYKNLYLDGQLGVRVMNALYGSGGELALTEAEKSEYFDENYMRADYLVLPSALPNGTPLSDAQKGEMLSIAQKMAETANKKSNLYAAFTAHFADVEKITEQTDEINAESFTKISKTDAFINPAALSIAADLHEQLKTAPIGEFAVFNNGTSIAVFRRLPLANTDVAAEYDKGIVSLMGAERFPDYLAKLAESAQKDIDKSARAHYSLDKIAF